MRLRGFLGFTLWMALMGLLVHFDGWLVAALGLFPDLGWDRALHLFWLGVAVAVWFAWGVEKFLGRGKDVQAEKEN